MGLPPHGTHADTSGIRGEASRLPTPYRIRCQLIRHPKWLPAQEIWIVGPRTGARRRRMPTPGATECGGAGVESIRWTFQVPMLPTVGVELTSGCPREYGRSRVIVLSAFTVRRVRGRNRAATPRRRVTGTPSSQTICLGSAVSYHAHSRTVKEAHGGDNRDFARTTRGHEAVKEHPDHGSVLAATVAMYRMRRTCARPPTILRRPRKAPVATGGCHGAFEWDRLLTGTRHHTVGMVPPSMTISVPVIVDARSEATNATSSATSSGRFGRPSGMPPSMSISRCRAVA